MAEDFNAAVIVLFGFGTDPAGRNQFLPGNAVVGYGFDIIASGYASRVHQASAVIEYGFDALPAGINPTAGTPATGMTVRQGLEDILRMWGLCCDDTDDLEQCVKDEALGILNGSMQFIFLHGKALPFLARRTRGYYAPSDEYYLTLEEDVQSVEGNVREAAWAQTRFANLRDEKLGSTTQPFATGGRVTFHLAVVVPVPDTFDLVLLYGTHYTDAESLMEAIQARIVNSSRVYVTYRPGDVLQIAFDKAPYVTVDFVTANQLTVLFGDVWSVGDGVKTENSTVFTSPSPSYYVPLSTKAEVRNYTALYGTAAPKAYFVECDQSGATGDSSRIRMHFSDPGAPHWLEMEVLVQPKRVTWADFNSSATLPFPHRYVESLLLPIARYRASSARRYRQRERHQSVVDQYKEALAMLGYADPQLAEVKEGRTEQ